MCPITNYEMCYIKQIQFFFVFLLNIILNTYKHACMPMKLLRKQSRSFTQDISLLHFIFSWCKNLIEWFGILSYIILKLEIFVYLSQRNCIYIRSHITKVIALYLIIWGDDLTLLSMKITFKLIWWNSIREDWLMEWAVASTDEM